jgi:hypothetical protein
VKALTATQMRGYVAAQAVSKASFRKAQRMVPVGTLRRAAFAAQAEIFLASVDRLGIDRTHPHVAVWCRQGQGNINARARDLAAIKGAAPVTVTEVTAA